MSTSSIINHLSAVLKGKIVVLPVGQAPNVDTVPQYTSRCVQPVVSRRIVRMIRDRKSLFVLTCQSCKKIVFSI